MPYAQRIDYQLAMQNRMHRYDTESMKFLSYDVQCTLRLMLISGFIACSKGANTCLVSLSASYLVSVILTSLSVTYTPYNAAMGTISRKHHKFPSCSNF